MNVIETNPKKATSFEEQIKILDSRGVIIKNHEFAYNILKRRNYYRFTAYLLNYKISDNKYKKVFFEEICELYEFDKSLRALLFNKLEDIEIAFRTHIAYLLGHNYGPYGYMESKNFQNVKYYEKMIKGIREDVSRSKEIFIQHHKTKYNSTYPIWVIIEILSFGELSKLYNNLLYKDQTSIGKNYYKIKPIYLSNWLQSLTVLRNRCAHHSRLFNRPLDIPIKIYAKDKKREINPNTLFAVIYTIVRLCTNQNEAISFIQSLENLFNDYKTVNIEYIGFPVNWKEILLSLIRFIN